MHAEQNSTAAQPADDDKTVGFLQTISLLAIIAAIALLGNWIATGVHPIEALPGMLVLCAISLVGLVIGRIMPFKMPTVAWVSLVAIIVTIPGVPGQAALLSLVDKVNFLAVATPILAYAGLALSQQEFKLARRAGWKIVIVAICVMIGTFVGSTIIADLTLRLLG